MVVGPGGNNHVPMVLIALQRMGADESTIERYVQSVRSRAGGAPLAAPDIAEIHTEDVTNYLGHFAAFPLFVAYFERRKKELGVEEMLSASIPILMNGVMGHAFHPLLRLGYALDLGDEDEVVYALAYWAAAYAPSPGVAATAPPIDARTQLAEIQEAFSGPDAGAKALTGNIQQRIQDIYVQPRFSSRLQPILAPPDRPLIEISALILDLFTRVHHFTILHAVTSCQALRLVLPHVRDPAPAISAYWHSICAASLTVPVPAPGAVAPIAADSDRDWDRLWSTAIASGNEHTIKLAYTCRLEAEFYGRPEYFGIAARECATPARFG